MWRHFIVDTTYLQEMRERLDLTDRYDETPYPFKCPTCDTQLPKLSSLFQHVETMACSQTLDEGAIGKLRRYLKSKLG
jgi:hypothetical protein